MGVSYGEDGYFKIKRGQNSCGIEQHMAVSGFQLTTSQIVCCRKFLKLAFSKAFQIKKKN